MLPYRPRVLRADLPPGYNLQQPPGQFNDPSTDPGSMIAAPPSMPILYDKLAHTDYALIYVDTDGKVRLQSSSSIASRCHDILCPKVRVAFARAVEMSRKAGSCHDQMSSNQMMATGRSDPFPSQIPHGLHDAMPLGSEGHMRNPIELRFAWPGPREPRLRSQKDSPQKHRQPRGVDASLQSNKKTRISVKDGDRLRRYYEKAFENLQQTNCRVLAKAYVKLVEPRKQVNYPYNGRKIVDGSPRQLDPDETKPPWWPAGVIHREPDHLPKAERIRLLLHILSDMRTSHGISVARLREADHPIRRQISPPERLQILDEVYQVRQEEEDFLEGRSDGQTQVWISCANLPEKAGSTASRERSSQSGSPKDRKTTSRSPSSTTVGSAADAPVGDAPPLILPPGTTHPEQPPSISHPLQVPFVDLETALPDASAQPIFMDASPFPTSPREVKRKRGDSNDLTVPSSIAPYCSPSHAGTQPVSMSQYSGSYVFQHQGTPPGGEQLGESMEDYAYPYFFHYET